MDTHRIKVLESWANNRLALEKSSYKNTVPGKKIYSRESTINYFLPLFSFGLKIFGLYNKAYKKAYDIQLNNIIVSFPELPQAFDGYSILHLTDLHLDALPGLEDSIISKTKDLSYDLCLITGDYRITNDGPFEQILTPLKKIIDNLTGKDGVYGVLGNHDTFEMIGPLEKIGLKMLINESVIINREKDNFTLTGIDDPHHHFSSFTMDALKNSSGDFKILMSHSPEISKLSDYYKYNLCLSGHTHAGQICLPGGKPLITHLLQEKDKFAGLWREGACVGYTSAGCGTSGIPLRINTAGEITLFHLKRTNLGKNDTPSI